MKRPIDCVLWEVLMCGAFFAYADGQQLPRNQDPFPPRSAGSAIVVSRADMIGIHDAKSARYNRNCLASGCHADLFDQRTLSAGIKPAHQILELMGITATNCTRCHESVEVPFGVPAGRGNAGNVGKNVSSVLKCFPCHSALGPAKQLYAR